MFLRKALKKAYTRFVILHSDSSSNNTHLISTVFKKTKFNSRFNSFLSRLPRNQKHHLQSERKQTLACERHLRTVYPKSKNHLSRPIVFQRTSAKNREPLMHPLQQLHHPFLPTVLPKVNGPVKVLNLRSHRASEKHRASIIC